MRGTVIQLDSLDPAKVVVVTRVLCVRSGDWEGGLRNKLVGLVVEVIMTVVAEKTGDQRGLSFIIVTQRCRSLSSQKQPNRAVD